MKLLVAPLSCFCMAFAQAQTNGAVATIFSDPLPTFQIVTGVVTADKNGNYTFRLPLNNCVNETVSTPGMSSYRPQNICGKTDAIPTPVPVSIAGTPGTTAASSRSSLQAAAPGAKSDIKGTVNALEYSGSDLGAQITAADKALGSNCGTIEVPPNATGLSVTTTPNISPCHRLWLRSPATWALNIGPVLNSNSVVSGDGSEALQTINTNHGWIMGTNLSSIIIDNIWATNTYAIPPVDGTALMQCYSCNGISVSRNHVLGAGIIFTGTTASGYTSLNSANLSQNIHIDDNFVDGQSKTVDLAELTYTQHATMTNNIVQNAQYGLQWWGGDAQTDGASFNNTRWAQDITVNGLQAYNVRSATWGGMGQDITISGVVANKCSDVCLDDESGLRVNFTNFAVHNAVAGGIATYWYSRQISFGPGVVTSDTATRLISARFYNATRNATRQFSIKVHNVKFQCNDASKVCPIYSDPIGDFEFVDNALENTTLAFVAGVNNSGFRIDGNRFTFSIVPSSKFSAISVPGIGSGSGANYSFSDSISGNMFRSDMSSQSSGTYAINVVNNDPSYVDTVVVRDNNTVGFTTDAVLVANSSNSGIAPVFILSNNFWGGNGVKEKLSGKQGVFRNIVPSPSYPLTGSSKGASWIKLGTWVTPINPPGEIAFSISAGSIYTTGIKQSNISFLHVRSGNNSGTPNIRDAQLYNLGYSVFDQVKIAATSGSTGTSNLSWDVYLHANSAFTQGAFSITRAPNAQWIPSNMTTSDPGSVLSTVFVGSVNRMTVPQTGTTGRIGGSALAAGSCARGTATLANSATGHTGIAAASDGSIQGNYTLNVSVKGNTATVSLCAITAGTPTAKTYNVTVF